MKNSAFLGDFNARVGTNHEVWSTCLDYHGTGKLKENSQRLLELCYARELCVSNTTSSTKTNTVSWMQDRWK
ncbi:hypothetical protein HOLleu_25270 [Holothuria leucospilota]|uniref:Craniofacial development protein 2-like n=1 Tax=Holothuria leucospilota TaxID=206669 RepID=A0A9Q1BS76_HOLLE|nr:hypothetical protein HOLleu_25270 [Holothuria leucospilota]